MILAEHVLMLLMVIVLGLAGMTSVPLFTSKELSTGTEAEARPIG
jgi:hypothetical protein